jgi:nitrate/nitrite-specific signal transduction histidine kinase
VVWARTNLTTRISILVTVGLLVVFAAFGFVSMWTLRQSTERTLRERLLLTEIAAESIDHYNRSVLEQLREMADLFVADSGDLRKTDDALKEARIRAKSFSSEILLLDKDGRVLSVEPENSTSVGLDLVKMGYVSREFGNGVPTISDVVPSLADGRPVVLYAAPVLNEQGVAVGAIAASLDLAQPYIAGFIEAIKLGKTGYAQVVDGKGELLASTQPADISAKSDHGDRFIALIEDKKAVVRTCHGCHEPQETIPTRKDVMAFAPLSSASWGVAVRQTEEEALAPTLRLKWGIIWMGLGSLVLAVGFTSLTTRRSLKPIRILTEGARRIASGDLSGQVKAKGGGEIGVLARTFEMMRGRLKATLQEIRDRAREVERRNQELSALNVITTTVGQSLDLDQSLQAVLDQTLAAMDSEAGEIRVADTDGEPMVLKARRGTLPIRTDPSGDWRQASTSSDDVPVATLASSLSIAEGEGATYLLRVPLLSKGIVQGWLIIAIERDRDLEHREMDLLVAIGHQIGVAVDNARLFRDEQRREQEAEALFHLGVQISALQEVDKTLRSVVEKARSLLRADVVMLALRDEVGERAHIRAVSGTRTATPARLTFATGQGFLGRVIALGESMAVEDHLSNAPDLYDEVWNALVAEEGLKSYLGVPLRIRDRVIGVLAVARRRKSGFRERDADLLSRLSHQTALDRPSACRPDNATRGRRKGAASTLGYRAEPFGNTERPDCQGTGGHQEADSGPSSHCIGRSGYGRSNSRLRHPSPSSAEHTCECGYIRRGEAIAPPIGGRALPDGPGGGEQHRQTLGKFGSADLRFDRGSSRTGHSKG